MTTVCKNCKLYKGDCGHHFVDGNGHIDYDIPDNKEMTLYGECVYYERKPETIYDLLEKLKKCNMTDKDKEIIKGIILSQNTQDDKIDIDIPLISVTATLKKTENFSYYKAGIIRGLQLAYLFFTDCLVTDDGYIFVGNGTKENVERFMESAKRYCHDVVFE